MIEGIWYRPYHLALVYFNFIWFLLLSSAQKQSFHIGVEIFFIGIFCLYISPEQICTPSGRWIISFLSSLQCHRTLPFGEDDLSWRPDICHRSEMLNKYNIILIPSSIALIMAWQQHAGTDYSYIDLDSQSAQALRSPSAWTPFFPPQNLTGPDENIIKIPS